MAENEPKNKLTEKPLLITTLPGAVSAKSRFYFVGFDGGVPSVGAKALGVENVESAIGESRSIMVLGISTVRAGGVVSVGDAVSGDSTGRAVVATAPSVTEGVYSAGTAVNGYALSASTAADDLISVILK